MKLGVLVLSAASAASLALAQTSSTPAAAPQSPAATATIKTRGPEAVASQDPNRVVAVIDGKQITASQALDMLKPFPPEQRKQYESNLSNVIQQVYMREQLASLAQKMNLDQQSPWKEQIELSRDNILYQAYLARVNETASKGPVPDAQQYYSSHPDDFDSVKLSGIFISFSPPGTPASAGSNARSEDQARAKAEEIEKKLQAGGDFAAIARTDSDNQGSAAKGGDLGTYETGNPQIPPAIKSAILKLQAGQVSAPVSIPSAFLIVKVDSRTKVPFEQAKNEISQRLQTESGQAAVKQELEKYKIQVQDKDFFETSSGPSAKTPSLARPGDAPPPSQPAASPKP